MTLTRVATSLLLALMMCVCPGEAVAGGKEKTASGLDRTEGTAYLNVNVDSLCRSIIAEYADAPVCGLWHTTYNATDFAILPADRWPGNPGRALTAPKGDSSPAWLMVVTSSPLPLLQPGTVIGAVQPGAKAGTYTARIYTDVGGDAPSSLKTFTLKMNDDGHISIRLVKKGLEISPWRAISWLLRGVVRYNSDSFSDIDGFIKVWPEGDASTTVRWL